MEFDDFFELVAQAEYARDLKIEDIHAGIVKAFNDIHSEQG